MIALPFQPQRGAGADAGRDGHRRGAVLRDQPAVVLALVAVDERLRQTCCWVSQYCPGRSLTLEQIGSIMGVSRERVRQIEAHALRKLRHPSRIKILKEHHL